MPTKLSIIFASILLASCGGDLYTPCVTVDDCPEGPKGELPICRDLGKAKICALS